ncbi:cytochrome P450 family protein [Lasiosphaeria ovina]|uniref:Cytochrome P450 family protein n=1 Tax=Lasiosphaeria ovina TaxID=92902 RepID=A0AAE0KHA2_9PEZI|nr:cytochrome P450 family protein [Lasiosphaeria ovina]
MALLNNTAVLAAAAAFVSWVIVSRVRTWYRLCHIPGPPIAAWSILWIFRHQISGRMCIRMKAICEQYGPVTRIGPNWVICNDPAEIRRIWSVHSGYQRSPWYKGFRFDPSQDSVLTANENKAHHFIRSQLLSGYNGVLNNQEKPVDEQVVKMLGVIERKYVSDSVVGVRPMDMGKTFLHFTQDATAAVGFGQSFGYIEADRDIFGGMAALEAMMLPVQLLALFPPLLALLKTPPIMALLPKPTESQGLGRLLGLIKAHVDERYGETKVQGTDVLQRFVESKLSRAQVEAEGLVMMIGGTDTTATALRCAVFYIATNASVCRRLQGEVDAASLTVARPVIADSEAKRLLYLQAVIKEVLRIWPPITGLMPKISSNDDVICGVKVPAGTNVAWAPFGIMRNRALFGDDADRFEPQRWLDAEPARLKEMEAVQGLAFAAGTRWECLGRRMAYMELGKVLFELFLRYDFTMTDPIKPFEWINHGFTVHEHMNVTITKRRLGVAV